MKPKLALLSLALFAQTTVFADVTHSDPLQLNWLDKSVSPSQDFYTYANGTWLKNNPIPADYSSWGIFNVVHEQVLKQLHQMMQQASQDTKAQAGSIEQKVGDFYYSGMDEARINQLGLKPLEPEFARINAISNLADLQREIPHLQLIGVDALFNFASMQDFANSERMIGAAMQAGLGLPDRDYYLKDDAKFKQIRDAYTDHIAKMLALMGDTPEQATKQAQTVMDIETQLAKVSLSKVAQRDPHAIYHMMNLTTLNKEQPNLKWSEYVHALGLEKTKNINLAMPEFFKFLNQQLASRPIEEWKVYLRWHLLDAYAPYLSKPFVDQNFKMVSVLTGAKQLQPRWKRVVNTENAALGFAVGKMYIDTYFPKQTKEQILDIIRNIRSELQQDIKTLPWMSPATRIAALKKLDLMGERVGYPSKWWDYSSLKIDRDSYALNILRANEFLAKRDLHKIGKPVDKTEWAMTPQTVNAYYDPSMNNINIPAGILLAPFFDPKAPVAMNYGSIGFVVGHEMTHGFDDEGAQFDGHGNLKNWWTAEDLKKFQAATACIANQFSQYTVDGGMHVQGKLVVGEATADLGGINLAYKAFHHSKDYQHAKTIDGITPDQQFFLGAAHAWATNIRPEQIQNQVTTDPHPPAKDRVNGSLVNVPQFQQAFKIDPQGSMVSKVPCIVW